MARRKTKDHGTEPDATLPDLSDYPPLMGADHVAGIFGVCKRTVWQWAQDRRLPFYRLGGGSRGPLRFARSDVIAFLKKSRVSPLEG